jgi:hypothetical protein
LGIEEASSCAGDSRRWRLLVVTEKGLNFAANAWLAAIVEGDLDVERNGFSLELIEGTKNLTLILEDFSQVRHLILQFTIFCGIPILRDLRFVLRDDGLCRLSVPGALVHVEQAVRYRPMRQQLPTRAKCRQCVIAQAMQFECNPTVSRWSGARIWINRSHTG